MENTENGNKVDPLFDIERIDLYEYGKPKDRTRKLLSEMAALGMKEPCMGRSDMGI